MKLIKWNVSKRYIIVAMVFVGYLIFFAIHTNVGMAVVAMTSPKEFLHPNGTSEMRTEYNWSSVERALVISSLSYGRLFGPAGAAFASKVGGSTLYLLMIIFAAGATFCSPYLLYVNFYLFVIGNALTGSCEAVAYASVSQIWARWAPPNERAKIISITMIGVNAGLIASFIFSGWILYEWGWAKLFHATGVVALVWAFLWYLVVKNDPDDDKYITEAERDFIKEQLGDVAASNKTLVYPWKDIFTCVPFWIVCLSKFTTGVGFIFTMMYFPQYIKDTNNIDIKKIGYISTIPQVCGVLAMIPGGWVFDYLKSNKILSLANVHKLFCCIGLFFGALTFLVAAFWPNFIVSVVCMSLFQFFISFTVLEDQVVVLDLAPNYAAFMSAMATSCFTVASILTPMAVGFIVTSHSRLQWSFCFVSFGIFLISGAVMSLKFLAVELQSWAIQGSDEAVDTYQEICQQSTSHEMPTKPPSQK